MNGTNANYHNDGRVEIIGTYVGNIDEELHYAVAVHKLTDLVGWGKWQAIIRIEYDEINFGVFAVDAEIG